MVFVGSLCVWCFYYYVLFCVFVCSRVCCVFKMRNGCSWWGGWCWGWRGGGRCWGGGGGGGGGCRTLWYSLVLASDGAWFVAWRPSSVCTTTMLWDCHSSVGTTLYTPSCTSVTAANMTSDDVVDIHAMS